MRGEEIRSCTILTTDANEIVGEIHHRMPVILPPEEHGLWLDPDMRELELFLDLLQPYFDDLMEAFPVSRFVNSPSNDDEQCVESVAQSLDVSPVLSIPRRGVGTSYVDHRRNGFCGC